MHLIYMGTGFVGACSSAVSADSGHSVLAYDINKEKIAKLSSDNPADINSCLHEEGLADLIIQHRDKLLFSANESKLTTALDNADAIFLCLPTPESSSGESDLSAFKVATHSLGKLMKMRNGGQQTKRMLLITKSTVPIDTPHMLKDIISGEGCKNFGVASNPEFLVEGQAIHDSIHPQRIVVGAETDADFKTLRNIYRRFYDSSGVEYLEFNPYEAAAVKLLSNTALFNKLVYTYVVAGRLCEYFPELDYENIRRGVISDKRIGKWGFYDSLYAGGSCLIKDAQSLSYQMKSKGADISFIDSILQANSSQLDRFIERAETDAGVDYSGKTVALIGLAFKQGTNDIRHSGSISIIRHLLGAGVKSIRAYDPAAMAMTIAEFPVEKNELNSKIVYCDSEKQALEDSPIVFIATDWPEFRTLGDDILEISPAGSLIMDGRRIISHRHEELREKGFKVISVGSDF